MSVVLGIHGGRVNTKVAWFQHWIDQGRWRKGKEGQVMQQTYQVIPPLLNVNKFSNIVVGLFCTTRIVMNGTAEEGKVHYELWQKHKIA